MLGRVLGKHPSPLNSMKTNSMRKQACLGPRACIHPFLHHLWVLEKRTPRPLTATQPKLRTLRQVRVSREGVHLEMSVTSLGCGKEREVNTHVLRGQFLSK
jgi:hypothetical protein